MISKTSPNAKPNSIPTDISTVFPPVFNDTLVKHELFAKALFERPNSLSEFLPYEEYLPEFELFRQKDGSLGCVYSVELTEHEAKNSQEIVSLLENLRVWFRFTEEFTLSLLFEQSRISAHDASWESLIRAEDLQRDDIPAKLHLAQIKRLRQTEEVQELSQEGKKAPPLPLKRRLFLSIRYFGEKSTRLSQTNRARQLGRELLNPNQTLSFEVEAFVKQLRSFNYVLSQFEMSSPLTVKRLDATALADFLRQTFNPVTYFKRPFAAVNPNLSLSQQVIFCPATLDHPGIEREGIQTRTLSLKNAPSFAYPGAMAYFLSLRFPFRICLNISFPSSSSVKKHFGVKEFFLQNTPSARSRRQKAEIDLLQEKLVRDDKVLQMTFFVLLEGSSDEELDIQTKECLVRFQQRLECEALVETDIGLGLWLNALPLNYHPIADYTSKRSIRILSSDIVHFCPVFDSYRGCQPSQAQSLFLSRENGLVPFGLKTTGNSHMTAVLGDTGSAKSGQVIKLLLGELRREPKPLIFVIDYKTSYGMLSQYLPSELTSFERGKPMPFSPFRGEPNELIADSTKWAGFDTDEGKKVTNLITSMVGDTVLTQGNIRVEYGPQAHAYSPRSHLLSLERTVTDEFCGKLLPALTQSPGESRYLTDAEIEKKIKDLGKKTRVSSSGEIDDLQFLTPELLRNLAYLPAPRRNRICHKLSQALAMSNFTRDMNQSLDVLTVAAHNPNLPPNRKQEIENKRAALKDQVELTIKLRQEQSKPMGEVMQYIAQEGLAAQDLATHSTLTQESNLHSKASHFKRMNDCSDGIFCDEPQRRP